MLIDYFSGCAFHQQSKRAVCYITTHSWSIFFGNYSWAVVSTCFSLKMANNENHPGIFLSPGSPHHVRTHLFQLQTYKLLLIELVSLLLADHELNSFLIWKDVTAQSRKFSDTNERERRKKTKRKKIQLRNLSCPVPGAIVHNIFICT